MDINIKKFDGDYLYLSHPRESMDYVRKWELEFERRSGINLLNPFFEISRENSDIDQNEKDATKAHKILNGSTVDDELIFILKGRRGLLTIIDGNYTLGASMEMVYAKLFGKPAHTLVTNGYENHPWVVRHSSEIYTDRDVMESRLIELYGNKKREVANG